MNPKVVITLILGLVFQLVQVLPASVISSPCQPQEESCACCTGADSCDCAVNEAPDQKPEPIPFTAASDLKQPAMKPVETRVSLISLPETQPAARPAHIAFSRPARGYTGVSLSVAFCTFVI